MNEGVDTEGELLAAIAERRAARRTPADDRGELLIGISATLIAIVIMAGAVSWLVARV